MTRYGLAVRLPWPPKELSPNARLHWAKLARAKAAYRQTCGWEVKRHAAAFGAGPHEQLVLTLEFFAPNKRSRDQDNLLASMKAGLDGMADALGINDSRWTVVLAPLAYDDRKAGYVVATLRWTA